MGWNSYNSYSCSPSEDIIKKNAQGLVDTGLAGLGYLSVTVDCGWPAKDRNSEGELQWNEKLFPSGGKALGEFIHDLGLKFGLYSGAGYLQCGSTDLPASLGYEDIDAESFAKWGGDTLKYDNCYATSKTVMVDADSEEAQSPSRFLGASADLDMLIVGLGALSHEEERFHFGMWAIQKSPLIIGAVIDGKSIPEESVKILSNKEVIAINQDSLAKQAELVLRYTEEEWDLWAGQLSGSRTVVGIANWRNNSQTVEVDLGVLGIAKADARDIWAVNDVGTVSGVETVDLAGHEMKLWILSNIESTKPPQSTGYYSAGDATLAGSATISKCGNDDCLPTNLKVGNIGPGAKVAFDSVGAFSSGTKLVGVDYINYEYAFHSAWEWGSNTRNMTISVNGGEAKRWAFPISGRDWYETGRLTIEVDGFVDGEENSLVFAVSEGDEWAPDLVGLELFE
ncbi:hypothetical protein QQX98_003402 [Neonectria punicea]|uniref:Alpha-galactosidase n=1 Tax=Neonectria punicea TaxID=979145 RepID=A0ABR1HDS0_9HYPO